MKPLRKAILAGVAAVALVGVAVAAVVRNSHVLDVRLPDGSMAQIHYVGDTPPTVSFAPAPGALPIFSPAFDPFGARSPFAALERISRAMDRQAETMLRQASAQPGLAFSSPDLMRVDVGKLPPGVHGYAMVSTISGDGVCTQSVEYRSLGDGKPPRVLTKTSGSCQADQARPARAATPVSTRAATPVDTAGQRI